MAYDFKYELSTNYDSAKSFYGKAYVEEDGDELRLYSYTTHVATIKAVYTEEEGVTRKVTYLEFYSQTTTRHIKEFLKQNGFKADSKAQMYRDYCKPIEEAKEAF